LTGYAGIDDVDLSGPFELFQAGAEPEATKLDPVSLGLTQREYAGLPGGDAEVNVGLFQELIAGGGDSGLADQVCLSAAVALKTSGKVASLDAGMTQARELLSSGATREKFESYKALAQRLAGS
jgi:anthranilate phosphoribosyltransferase